MGAVTIIHYLHYIEFYSYYNIVNNDGKNEKLKKRLILEEKNLI